jgi:hypothetical protein
MGIITVSYSVPGKTEPTIPFDFGKLTLTTIVDGDGNPCR